MGQRVGSTYRAIFRDMPDEEGRELEEGKRDHGESGRLVVVCPPFVVLSIAAIKLRATGLAAVLQDRESSRMTRLRR